MKWVGNEAAPDAIVVVNDAGVIVVVTSQTETIGSIGNTAGKILINALS